MKTLLIGILFIFFHAFGYCQGKDSAIYKIGYTVTQLYYIDSLQPKNNITLEYPLVLFLGKKMSFSTGEMAFRNDSILADLTKSKNITSTEDITELIKLMPKQRLTMAESSKYYFSYNNKVSTEINKISTNQYQIIDTNAVPEWTIAQETKTIDGVSCRKATTQFKGRKWIAWFTPQVAAIAGPWKLNGLPGLIVLATDENAEFVFKLNYISPSKSNVIQVPENVETVSRVKLHKLIEAYAKNPMGFLYSNSIGQIGSVEDIKFGDGANPIINKPLKIPNNPFEKN